MGVVVLLITTTAHENLSAQKCPQIGLCDNVFFTSRQVMSATSSRLSDVSSDVPPDAELTGDQMERSITLTR